MGKVGRCGGVGLHLAEKGLASLLVFAFYLAWHFIYAAWSFRCANTLHQRGRLAVSCDLNLNLKCNREVFAE